MSNLRSRLAALIFAGSISFGAAFTMASATQGGVPAHSHKPHPTPIVTPTPVTTPTPIPTPTPTPTPVPTPTPTPVPTPTPTPGDPWAVPFGSRPASGPINLSGAACNGITISNKTFANLGAGVRAITLTSCTNVIIEQVDFINVAEGVISHGGTNITVRDSRYQNILGPAHDASGNRTANLANFVQYDNVAGGGVIHNKGKCGDTEDIVSLTGSTHDVIASDNWFEGALADSPGCLAWKSNSGSGIAVADGNGTRNSALRNIVLTPGQVGIFINGGTQSHIDDNLIMNQPRAGNNVGIYVDHSPAGCGNTVLRDRVNWHNAAGQVNGIYDPSSDGCVPDKSGSNFNDPTLDPNAYHVTL